MSQPLQEFNFSKINPLLIYRKLVPYFFDISAIYCFGRFFSNLEIDGQNFGPVSRIFPEFGPPQDDLPRKEFAFASMAAVIRSVTQRTAWFKSACENLGLWSVIHQWEC